MKVVLPVTASNAVPNLQMTSIGSHSTSEGEKSEIKKEWGGQISGKDFDFSPISKNVISN